MTGDEHDLVRQQFFDCDGPVDIDIELSTGSIEVRFADEMCPTVEADRPEEADPSDVAAEHHTTGGYADTTDGTEPADESGQADATVRSDGLPHRAADPVDPTPAIMVEVRHEPAVGPSWGLIGLLNWVGGRLGATGNDLAAQAVRETGITVRGNRLTVHGPRSVPLGTVPLAVVVHAPAGSSLNAGAGAASVQVGGPAGRVTVDTSSGDISVDRATGPVWVKTGSGSIRLGPMPDGLSVRSGSGDLEVTSLNGSGSLHSGSGDIWIGSVHGDVVTVRTGSGDLTVADAGRGLLQLATGSGELRVGIRSGVLAEVDMVSGSGRARSDLPVSQEPPTDDEAALRVRARTGSGDAVVGAATA
jgi:Putative adhesin